MRWTSEKPTKAGWYWRRLNGNMTVDEIVSVAGILYVQFNSRLERGDDMLGEWSSEPLTPPEEAP